MKCTGLFFSTLKPRNRDGALYFFVFLFLPFLTSWLVVGTEYLINSYRVWLKTSPPSGDKVLYASAVTS